MSDIYKDYHFAKGRAPGCLHISARFMHPPKNVHLRFAHRVFSGGSMPELLKENGEVVLHTTATGIQQVKAKFLEDGRHISHLWIQRWNTKNDNPIGEQVVLYGDQIAMLMEFLTGVAKLEIPHERTFNVNFDDLRLVHMPSADAKKVLAENPDLVIEFARSKITTEDVVALAYRRKALSIFLELLEKDDTSENDWQVFFERNKWIFGYGLAYIFTTSFELARV